MIAFHLAFRLKLKKINKISILLTPTQKLICFFQKPALYMTKFLKFNLIKKNVECLASLWQKKKKKKEKKAKKWDTITSRE